MQGWFGLYVVFLRVYLGETESEETQKSRRAKKRRRRKAQRQKNKEAGNSFSKTLLVGGCAYPCENYESQLSSQHMEKYNCSKPPTSLFIRSLVHLFFVRSCVQTIMYVNSFHPVSFGFMLFQCHAISFFSVLHSCIQLLLKSCHITWSIQLTLMTLMAYVGTLPLGAQPPLSQILYV